MSITFTNVVDANKAGNMPTNYGSNNSCSNVNSNEKAMKSNNTIANNNQQSSSCSNANISNGSPATYTKDAESIESKLTNMAYHEVKDSACMLHRNVESALETWQGMDECLSNKEGRLSILANLLYAVTNEKNELESQLHSAEEKLRRVEECVKPYQAMEDPVVSHDGQTYDRKKGRSKPLPRSVHEQNNTKMPTEMLTQPTSSSYATSLPTTPFPIESNVNEQEEVIFANKSLTTVLERLRNALNKGSHLSSTNQNNNNNNSSNSNNNTIITAKIANEKSSSNINVTQDVGLNIIENTNNINRVSISNDVSNDKDNKNGVLENSNSNNNNDSVSDSQVALHPQQAEVNARGELVHPCLRVYGFCNFNGTCSFANYPYDACLSHLKSKCRFGNLCHERHVEFRGPLDSNGILIEPSTLLPQEQEQEQQQELLLPLPTEHSAPIEPTVTVPTLSSVPLFTVHPSN